MNNDQFLLGNEMIVILEYFMSVKLLDARCSGALNLSVVHKESV